MATLKKYDLKVESFPQETLICAKGKHIKTLKLLAEKVGGKNGTRTITSI